MHTATDLADCSAIELLQLYRSRNASPVEATRAVLARIERLNPPAQCLLPPGRRRGADLAAPRPARHAGAAATPCGVLDGVPVSIKDLILTRGWPTRRGSAHGRSEPALGRRRAGHGAAARGRRGAAGQDDDAGVRLQGRDQFAADRHHAQPLEPGEDARRLLRRHGRRGGRRHGAAGGGHRRRRRRCASRRPSAATSA